MKRQVIVDYEEFTKMEAELEKLKKSDPNKLMIKAIFNAVQDAPGHDKEIIAMAIDKSFTEADISFEKKHNGGYVRIGKGNIKIEV